MAEKEDSKDSFSNERTLGIRALADAFIASSKHSRLVIIVIIFASVLATIGAWNSQQKSWTQYRLGMAKYAVRHQAYRLINVDSLRCDSLAQVFVLMNDDNLLKPQEKVDSILGRMEAIIKDRCPLIRNIDSFSIKYGAEKDSLWCAVKLCENRQFYSDTFLNQFISDLERLRVENIITVQIPIFGVVIDVNDLGILSGLAFSVVLLWFRFCLWREFTNLRLLFDKVREGPLFEVCYDYLAMGQVLTIPQILTKSTNGPPRASSEEQISPQKTQGSSKEPQTGLRKWLLLVQIFYEVPDKTNRIFWSLMEKLLFILPLAVQTYVFIHDLVTANIGEMIGKSLTHRGLWLEFFFLVVILILTVRCLFISYFTTKIWDDAYSRLETQREKRRLETMQSGEAQPGANDNTKTA